MKKDEKIFLKALFWEEKGMTPSFKNMEIKRGERELIVEVKAAMFGKALYRAITIGHPKILPPRVMGTLLSGIALNSFGKIKKGTRVVVNPHATNLGGKKIELIPGAISEKVIIRNAIDEGVFEIPDKVNFEEAVYTELVSCAMGALKKVNDAEVIVIIGCGLMALILIQLAKNMGISKIVCIYNHSNRKNIIEKNGAMAVAYSKNHEILRKSLKEKIHLSKVAIIDSAGSKASAELAFALGNQNSKIILFAGYPIGTSIALDLNRVHYDNISIVGSYHFDNEIFSRALKILQNEKIDLKQLITNRIYWKDINKLYEEFDDKNNISNIILFD